MNSLKFADANSSFNDAKFVIFGVPFDSTSSFRSGSRFAPNRIREASYNFETYLMEQDVDLIDIPFHDAGNLDEYGNVDEMTGAVEDAVKKILPKFPILIGGEHSLTIGAVKTLKNVSVVFIDAHLDFREEYLGIKNSHACVSRRVSEIVGIENVFSIGVRSFSREEKNDAEKLGLKYVSSFDVKEKGIENIIRNLNLKKKIYLSLDMDGVDPAFAPGVGNPEPFGLTPLDVVKCIKILSDRLVGFDVAEVCPPYDNGNTSLLGARIIRDLIGCAGKYRI
ncbi:MAG: agmatinase [Euryarchaeota archaeon CG01_land_8_20_14_3_00_38_12]|nr:MAG: agmatinase [Euryarchaeota archaeon CG01_land_8_20_14_3_00_38_12]